MTTGLKHFFSGHDACFHHDLRHFARPAPGRAGRARSGLGRNSIRDRTIRL